MKGDIFFSEAKKGYNKDEVHAFIKKLNEENEDALLRKADEQKRLLNDLESQKQAYEKRIAELETELSEKVAKCEENAAKYEELCARMGEKLLFAEQQAEKIVADANAKKQKIDEEAALKAEQNVAAITAKAREDIAAVLRAAEIMKQKSMQINSGLEQTKRILEDAITQVEKAAKNA